MSNKFEIFEMYRQREREAIETLLAYKGIEVDLYPVIKDDIEMKLEKLQ